MHACLVTSRPSACTHSYSEREKTCIDLWSLLVALAILLGSVAGQEGVDDMKHSWQSYHLLVDAAFSAVW